MIPYIEKTRQHILELAESDFGMTAPGLELNQMEHENVNVRIFISQEAYFMAEPIRIGIGGPVGAGKTQLIEKVVKVYLKK